MILKLKKKLNEKRAAAQKILTTVGQSAETRDMSPEEKTQFDQLLAEVDTIKGQIAQWTEMEADEASDVPAEEPRSTTPTPEPRSLPQRRGAPIAEAPAVHTKKRPYSILRALAMASDGFNLDGIEGEVSKEIETRTGRKAKGFFLPTGADPELRELMNGGRKAETRADLTTSTGAGAIFTVPELPLIDLLRAKMVTAQLGATMLTGMQGLFAIPRQSGTATVYWLSEGTSATATAPALDQVPFTPKVAIAATNISRLFMNQTSVDAETFVKNDLAAAMARDLDRVGIVGGGTNEPVGVAATSAVITNSAGLQGGTNGAVLTWAQITGLEAQVSGYNADSGKLAYLTNPSLRGSMKNTLRFPSTASAQTLWEDGPGEGIGEVNGYKAMTTTNVPKNLTKGTAAGICSALIYGDWSSLVIAQWEGVDVVVNPYTNQLAGAVVISMEMSVDVRLRHPESFAVILDAKLS
jgi:HK97 family phage major capsid protein